MKLFTVQLRALVVLVACLVSSFDRTVSADTIAMTLSGAPSSSNDSNFLTIGWEFTTAHAIQVTELGSYSTNLAAMTGDHDVAIWQVGNSTPLVSATVNVPSAAPGTSYDYAPVSYTLPAGSYYIAGEYDNGGVSDNFVVASGPTFASGISLVGGIYQETVSAGLQYPTNPSGATYANVNFQFGVPVPEPGSLALIALGGGALLLAAHRRRMLMKKAAQCAVLLVLATCLVSAVGGTASAASMEGIIVSGGSVSPYSNNISDGWQFTTSATIYVTGLGIIDNSALNGDHGVAIYTDIGDLGAIPSQSVAPLASTTVTVSSSDPTDTTVFTYQSIPTLTLAPGTYRVAAYDANPSTFIVSGTYSGNTDITSEHPAYEEYAGATGVFYPGNSTTTVFLANFEYTTTPPPAPAPEPGSLVLLALSGAGLFYITRRRRMRLQK